MSNTGPAQTSETLSTDAQRIKEQIAQALLIPGYVRPIEWAREVADAVMTVVAPLLAGARHSRGRPDSGPVADGWMCRDCGHPDSPFQPDDSWQCERHKQ